MDNYLYGYPIKGDIPDIPFKFWRLTDLTEIDTAMVRRFHPNATRAAIYDTTPEGIPGTLIVEFDLTQDLTYFLSSGDYWVAGLDERVPF